MSRINDLTRFINNCNRELEKINELKRSIFRDITMARLNEIELSLKSNIASYGKEIVELMELELV
jgi:hypothetical protein